MLNTCTKEKFHEQLDKKFEEDDLVDCNLLFADFQRDAEVDEYGSILSDAPFVYEAVPSIEKIKERVN